MTDFEYESETGMGDVALLLGWTPPQTDDGFWFREDHGPTHDGDLRPFLIEDLRQLLVDPQRLESSLVGLHGKKSTFRPILANPIVLMEKVCRYAECKAGKRNGPEWSIIGLITGHGSGVASAIYELYRKKAPNKENDA